MDLFTDARYVINISVLFIESMNMGIENVIIIIVTIQQCLKMEDAHIMDFEELCTIMVPWCMIEDELSSFYKKII